MRYVVHQGADCPGALAVSTAAPGLVAQTYAPENFHRTAVEFHSILV